MKAAKYFKPEEFSKCSPACSIENMSQELLDILDAIRERCGFPLVLTSAYRSPQYDRSKGRSGTGAHTLGLAVDIRCSDPAKRMAIIRAALAEGVKRIGVAGSFVHLDISTKHAQDIIWTY